MSQIRRMAYLLVLLFGGALLTAMVWKPAPPPVFHGIADSAVPLTVDGFTSSGDYPEPDSVKAALQSATVISRTYIKDGQQLDFTLIGGTDRTALHDSRSCLIGAGSQVDAAHSEMLPGTTVEAQAYHVHTDGVTQDMVDWYVENGHIISQTSQIRAQMLVSALFGRRNDPIYFFRFMGTLPSDPQAAAAAHEHLMKFAADMWTTLQPVVSR